MAFLYKFTCKPNNPVVSEAVLMVWLTYKPKYMMQELSVLAYERGCVHALGDSTCEYLGELDLSGVAEMYSDGVITCVTGEY